MTFLLCDPNWYVRTAQTHTNWCKSLIVSKYSKYDMKLLIILYICGEHVGTTMVVPKVYPEHACWKGFQMCSRAVRPKRTYIQRVQPEAAPCLHSRPNSTRVSSEPLPPEQPRVVIPLSRWHRRYDNDTRISRILSKTPATSKWTTPLSVAKK